MTGDWHFDRLVLENFRQYEHLEIEFNADLTLLIGENGAGKTGVLDALSRLLATVLHGSKHEGGVFTPLDARVLPRDLDSIERTSTFERAFPVSIAGVALLSGREFTWERRIRTETNRATWGSSEVREFSSRLFVDAVGLDPEVSSSTVLPVLAYYGVSRLIGERQERGSIPASRMGAYASALDPRSDLKRLFSFLQRLDSQIMRAHRFNDPEPRAAMAQFEAIDLACASMLSPSGWHRMRWNEDIQGVTLHHAQHGTLPLTLLATGTRIAAGLAIDLASRMARANPGLGGRNLLESTPGIVLIDEVDLHLHPSWQQQIVPLLQRTFPRVQFVLTTHSPQVISTVSAKSVRMLDGSTVNTPMHAQGLRANVVLESLQGVDPVPDVPARAVLDDYLALVGRGEGRSARARHLREQIDIELGGPALNPELIDVDVALAFDEWDS